MVADAAETSMIVATGANALPAAPLRAIGLMLLGVALLSIMDAVMKVLVTYYPIPNLIVFRAGIALPILAVALRFDGGLVALRNARHGLQLLRGALVFATGWCFFAALALLPLADTLAVAFVAPVVVALLAGPLLGERADRRTWIAIALGFIGVLVIVRPEGAVWGQGAVLALLAALFYALAMVLLRHLGRTDTAAATTLYSTAVTCLLATAIAAADWWTPGAADWPLLIAAGALGALGTLALSAAFRRAAAATLTPLEYTAMVWGVALGFVVFGDVPGTAVLIGAALITASGLVLARR
jgi:drug/metabolite transporter (DMT)-like permease